MSNKVVIKIDGNVKHGVDKNIAAVLSDIIRDAIHSVGEYEVLGRDDHASRFVRGSFPINDRYLKFCVIYKM